MQLVEAPEDSLALRISRSWLAGTSCNGIVDLLDKPAATTDSRDNNLGSSMADIFDTSIVYCIFYITNFLAIF